MEICRLQNTQAQSETPKYEVFFFLVQSPDIIALFRVYALLDTVNPGLVDRGAFAEISEEDTDF